MLINDTLFAKIHQFKSHCKALEPVKKIIIFSYQPANGYANT